MKQCPFCGASLQEDARFCLYCMRPLEEKKMIPDPPLRHRKRWMLVAAAIAVCLVAGLCFFLRRPPVSPVSDPPVTGTSAESGTSTTDGGVSSVGTETTAPPRSTSADGTTDPAETASRQKEDPPTSAATTRSTATTQSTITTKSTATTQTTTTKTTAPTTSTKAADTAVYQYRAAKSGDDNYAVHTAFSEDAIVITGISKAAADGVYRIPEIIDGKRVVAIMGYAFNAKSVCATVKKVVLPPSVKAVWAGAFSACIHLTDIYFSADVYIDEAAFAPKENRTGTLTIHCPPSCTDRNFYKYSRIAADYGAAYAEWNGGAL